jgi:hypothetical protein
MEQTSSQGDNQQVRRAFMRGYLAGMIDGEGSIMMIKERERRARYVRKNGEISMYKHTFYVPAISISNTNREIINTIHTYLTEFNIAHYVVPEHQDFRDKGWKTSKKILIRGWKRCKAFIEKISFEFLAKSKQLDLMKQLIEIRWNILCKKDEPKHYIPQEINLINQIKQLNQKGSQPQRLYASTALL